MKIQVYIEASETKNVKTVDIGDLDFSEKEWNNLSESRKTEIIEEYVEDLPEQPYWMLERFKEKE